MKAKKSVMYVIYAKYLHNNFIEEIDEYIHLWEAKEMLIEYKLAYGNNFRIWIKKIYL